MLHWTAHESQFLMLVIYLHCYSIHVNGQKSFWLQSREKLFETTARQILAKQELEVKINTGIFQAKKCTKES